MGNQTSFRWTSAGGMQDLGTVPGPDYAEFDAGAVNNDGSKIVGYVFHSTDFSRAALWTPSLGVVDLTTYLPSVGVDLTGWKLGLAYGISDDGTAITGEGSFEGQARGWIVTGLPVPEPGTVGLLTVFVAGALARRRRPLGSKPTSQRTVD